MKVSASEVCTGEDRLWLEAAQFEALWQMGYWQEAPEPSAQHMQGNDSFHATVCACLKVTLQILDDAMILLSAEDCFKKHHTSLACWKKPESGSAL